MSETAIYMISVSSSKGLKGAVLVEFDSCPDVKMMRVDPDGNDVKDMGLNQFYTAKQMKDLGY